MAIAMAIAITTGSFSPLFYLSFLAVMIAVGNVEVECDGTPSYYLSPLARAYPPTWLPAGSIIYGCNSMMRNMAGPSYQSGEVARRIQLPRTQTRRAPRSSFVPLKWENRNR